MISRRYFLLLGIACYVVAALLIGVLVANAQYSGRQEYIQGDFDGFGGWDRGWYDDSGATTNAILWSITFNDNPFTKHDFSWGCVSCGDQPVVMRPFNNDTRSWIGVYRASADITYWYQPASGEVVICSYSTCPR